MSRSASTASERADHEGGPALGLQIVAERRLRRQREDRWKQVPAETAGWPARPWWLGRTTVHSPWETRALRRGVRSRPRPRPASGRPARAPPPARFGRHGCESRPAGQLVCPCLGAGLITARGGGRQACGRRGRQKAAQSARPRSRARPLPGRGGPIGRGEHPLESRHRAEREQRSGSPHPFTAAGGQDEWDHAAAGQDWVDSLGRSPPRLPGSASITPSQRLASGARRSSCRGRSRAPPAGPLASSRA